MSEEKLFSSTHFSGLSSTFCETLRLEALMIKAFPVKGLLFQEIIFQAPSAHEELTPEAQKSVSFLKNL
jgi:hypothetical protein